MQEAVEALVERLFGVKPLRVDPLPGGITNANYKVDLGDEQLVVRIPGKDTELLGVDRRVEAEANRLAAAIGVAPELVAVDEETGSIVTRFLEARTISVRELAADPMLGEVVGRLREVHRAGTIDATFDHFAVIRRYHELAESRGVKEPFEYRSLLAVLEAIEAARPFRPTVLGHNDLLNANLLYDGRVRILDWEYAGMGDPFFDLANLSVNNELGEDCDEPILLHYFGRIDGRLLAAFSLLKLVSEFREAMWAVVQMAVSDLEIDFPTYAADRAERFGLLAERTDIAACCLAARGY